MDIVYNQRAIVINVHVTTGLNDRDEDFKRCSGMIALLEGPREKYGYYIHDHKRDDHGNIHLAIAAPANPREGLIIGVYNLRLIWFKKRGDVTYDTVEPQFTKDSAANIMQTCVISRIFGITDTADDDNTGYDPTNPKAYETNYNNIHTEPYGIDGMSAFEIALLHSKTDMRESEWIETYQNAEARVNWQMDPNNEGSWAQMMAQWNDTHVVYGDVTNNPDNEDLESVLVDDQYVIRRKSRAVGSSQFGGMGYVILRKNIQNVGGVDKNILTQAMMSGANTIYEIQYDFDLNGETINVPSGCVLNFQGGSLSNGTLNCDGTIFCSLVPIEQVLHNVERTGTWTEQELEVEDGSITTPKLAKSAVNTDKIDDESVTPEKLSSRVRTEVVQPAVNESIVPINQRVRRIDEDVADVSRDVDSLNTSFNSSMVQVSRSIDTTNDRINETNEALDIVNTDVILTNNRLRDNYYTSAEISSMFSPGAETPVVLLDSEDSTVADTLDAVPLADRPNKIFRVKSDNNTAYEERAWNGEKWVLLAEKDYGIESDHPKENSTDLITSGAVEKVAGSYIPNSNNMLYAVTDAEGKMLMGFDDNGTAMIPGLPDTRGDAPSDIIQMTIDKDNKIVSYRTEDGTLHENKISIQDIKLGEEAVNHIREASGCGAIEPISDSDDLDIPLTEEVAMVIKKADSMSQIEWTPIYEVPARWYFNTNRALNKRIFPAGTTVKGIPYSQTNNINKVVGYDVSLETFMTAVHNPYSLLYTENISRDYPNKGTYPDFPQSAYGYVDRGYITVVGEHGTETVPDHRTYKGISNFAAAYFGNVCSAFSSYVIGLANNYGTGDYPEVLNKIYKNIGKVHPQNSQGVRTGDILYSDGHCEVVKNVKRDRSGIVTEVYMVEQGNINVFETLYSASKFDQHIQEYLRQGKDPILYRATPAQLAHNIEMFEFDADTYVYNDKICTFAGNKALFIEGDLIFIHCFDMNATHMELYKDDVLEETISLASDSRVSRADQDITYPSSSGEFTTPQIDVKACRANPNYYHILKDNAEPIPAYAVNLSSTNLTYGTYKARLIGGSEPSDFTYFKVIDANVSADNSAFVQGSLVPEDSIHVSFSCHNATPVIINILNDNDSGATCGTYLIQPEDYVVDENGIHGDVTINVDYFLAQGTVKSDGGKRDFIITSNEWWKLIVKFKDDWGRVANIPIEVKFIF